MDEILQNSLYVQGDFFSPLLSAKCKLRNYPTWSLEICQITNAAHLYLYLN